MPFVERKLYSFPFICLFTFLNAFEFFESVQYVRFESTTFDPWYYAMCVVCSVRCKFKPWKQLNTPIWLINMSADNSVHVSLVVHWTIYTWKRYCILHNIVYSPSPPWTDVVQYNTRLPIDCYVVAAAYEKLIINNNPKFVMRIKWNSE